MLPLMERNWWVFFRGMLDECVQRWLLFSRRGSIALHQLVIESSLVREHC